MMFGILDYIKIGAGVAVGVLLTMLYWTGLPLLNEYPILHRIPLIGQIAVGHAETVKEAGRAEIRIEWAEANRKAEMRALELQKQQQAKRDEADAELARLRVKNVIQTNDLETALAAERAKSNEKGATVCLPPPMPSSVRNALNAIR